MSFCGSRRPLVRIPIGVIDKILPQAAVADLSNFLVMDRRRAASLSPHQLPEAVQRASERATRGRYVPVPLHLPTPGLTCPSSRPDVEGAVAFAVTGGADVEVQYLQQPRPAAELLALAQDASPSQVFRFAASCATSACPHFEDHACSLAGRVVAHLPPVVDVLPACRIRASCRWHRQEGRDACLRCPQVVTENPNPSALLRLVAQDPAAPPWYWFSLLALWDWLRAASRRCFSGNSTPSAAD